MWSLTKRKVRFIEDIYGFSVSHEMVSEITDVILPELEECAVYTIFGYDLNGCKEILGLWLSETESKNYWMQIFDELRQRGIEDVFFISMDSVSGLEEGAKAIFPKVIVQRCIVLLIRNSIKYVPSKNYKKFTQDLKGVY